ncbi:MAG: hypothetical protein KDC54_16385 [Lewinella sp.]|nr:hypothetical protein [Lewinella sp.]
MALTDVQATLKERVAKGLNFGIEAFEEVVNTQAELYNEFILLKSKYNDLMYISSINTLPYEQLEVGLDRLRNNLLNLVDRLAPDSMQREEVNPDVKVQALPTRRTNFFKLIDIHFKNLEDIALRVIDGEREEVTTGRAAIFKIYRMHIRRFRNREDPQDEKVQAEVRAYFADFFRHETGLFEVYFKNIRHMLAYTQESEVERQFFLDTLRSLFTRYELALLHYYTASGIDPQMAELTEQTQLIDTAAIAHILLAPAPEGDGGTAA